MSVFFDLPAAVAVRIKTILPELRECKAVAGRFNLERLLSEQVRSPAVLVSLLSSRQQGGTAGSLHHHQLNLAAFIVTQDRPDLPRDEAGANIAAALAAYIPDRRFGQANVGEATNVSCQCLVSKAASARARSSLWAVTWSQPAVLTQSDASEPLAMALYVGQTPDVGPDHIDDYEEIGVAP